MAFENDFKALPNDLQVLIQVYDGDKDKLLAGAKLSTNSVVFPTRFQLFKENLLIQSKLWESFGEFDQTIKVEVCEKILSTKCNGKVYYTGESVSKSVEIGNADTGIRKIRIFPYITLKKNLN